MRAAAAGLLLLAALPARADDLSGFAKNYQDCVQKAAHRLATGPDAADVIARSSTVLCRKVLQTVPGGTSVQNLALVEELQKRTIENVTILILEARAKK